MNFKNFLITIIGSSLLYILSATGSGCAQIGTPQGGPKDTIPPVLVNAYPPEGTLHFKGNKVVFTFDEYVHLQDMQSNMLFSPTPKNIPDVTSKLKTVTVKIRDTLEPNTTYRFDFGSAIQDIDENNPIRNFSYIFSTGSYIDSLEFSGKVILAETGKPDSTLLVLLYKDLSDSAVLKHKPRYITRLDKDGNFTFQNLPGGTYHVYALDDKSGQRVYNGNDELFAFLDSTIEVSGSSPPVTLWAYSQEKPAEKKKPVSTAASNKEKKLLFSASLSNSRQDLLSPLILEFNNKLKDFDSLKVRLTDTLYHSYKNVTISLDSTGKQLIVQNDWVPNTDYRLVIPKDFATDTMGVALLKSDTLKFKTKVETEYGSITINFKNLEKIKNPVLQFVANNAVVNSYPLKSPTLSVKLFEPGDYELRILEDTNGNGVWDPGNYHLKLQPEHVISISQKLNIRADWDNERDIIL